MPPKQIPEPWKKFFRELDNQLTENVELVCLGGFVLSVLYRLPRPTSDVDAISIAPTPQREQILKLAGQSSALHEKYRVYIQHVTIAPDIDEYETRLTEMFPETFKRLRFLALDPYDLALSKLERNSLRDRDDITFLARTVPLDLQVLTERYQKSVRPFLGNPQREDLTLQLWIDMIEEERRR
jgi:Nucleotidyltransferase of unknown function (DUF6036)